MIKSESFDALFKALSKAQSEMTSARKSKEGHGYNYADLAECIETARKPLSENGLAVTQMLSDSEKGTALITMLTHESGQYIGSEFTMEKAALMGGAGKNPAQQMGASITYMRRYAFASIVGLAQEDNDAADAREREQQQKNYNPENDIAALKACTSREDFNSTWLSLSPVAQNNSAVKAAAAAVGKKYPKSEPMTDQQRKAIMAYYSNSGATRDQRIEDLSGLIGRNIQSASELTKHEAQSVLDRINRG